MKNLYKKIAFTLAEVIIVVAIIGMIAEMTIPSLMQNVQKQQFVSNFLEDYSIIATGKPTNY